MTHELRLHIHELGDGGDTVRLPAATRVVYVVAGEVTVTPVDRDGQSISLGGNEAALETGPVDIDTVDGGTTILTWDLVEAGASGADDVALSAAIDLDPDVDYLMRCDRVDFPPGGVARLHTHQGPGTRCLLHGALRVEVDGDVKSLGPLEPWFERGPDPVFASASDTEQTAFVRAMVLPRRLMGQSSIQYVHEEDRDKPKDQTYTVFVDEAITVPGAPGGHGH